MVRHPLVQSGGDFAELTGADTLYGGGLIPVAVSAAGSVLSGFRYLVDASGGSTFALLLPPSPTVGDQVEFLDIKGKFATTPITLTANGNNIDGIATDLTMDLNNVKVTLTFSGDINKGWSMSVGSNQVVIPTTVSATATVVQNIPLTSLTGFQVSSGAWTTDGTCI